MKAQEEVPSNGRLYVLFIPLAMNLAASVLLAGMLCALVKFVGREDKHEITKILHIKPDHDLAELQADIDSTSMPFSDDVLFQIGEKILAIGNPEGLEGTVSEQLTFPVERSNK